MQTVVETVPPRIKCHPLLMKITGLLKLSLTIDGQLDVFTPCWFRRAHTAPSLADIPWGQHRGHNVRIATDTGCTGAQATILDESCQLVRMVSGPLTTIGVNTTMQTRSDSSDETQGNGRKQQDRLVTNQLYLQVNMPAPAQSLRDTFNYYYCIASCIQDNLYGSSFTFDLAEA